MDIRHPACLIGYQQENFANIESFKHLTGKKTLAIFFSAATNDLKDYADFLEHLKNNFDVVFVDDGYYGLCDDGQELTQNYSSDIFVDRFFEHYQNLINKYEQIILVGQSMGTIISLKLQPKIPRAKMVLTSAPYSEIRFRFDPMDQTFIKFLLDSEIGRELLDNEHDNFWNINFHRFLNLLPPNTGIIFERAQLKSFAHCLDDVHKFGLVNPSDIPEDWLIFFGRNDFWIADFCVQDKIRQRKNTFILNCGHGILQDNWPEVMAKVKEIYPELFSSFSFNYV